jgi:hypothetical protein
MIRVKGQACRETVCLKTVLLPGERRARRFQRADDGGDAGEVDVVNWKIKTGTVPVH